MSDRAAAIGDVLIFDMQETRRSPEPQFCKPTTVVQELTCCGSRTQRFQFTLMVKRKTRRGTGALSGQGRGR